jgi:hypothetical protein
MKERIYTIKVSYDERQDCYIARAVSNSFIEGYGQTAGEALIDFGERLDAFYPEEEDDEE